MNFELNSKREHRTKKKKKNPSKKIGSKKIEKRKKNILEATRGEREKTANSFTIYDFDKRKQRKKYRKRRK